MVIFVMALDGYTKTLQEDKKTNCMIESVRLLKVLANKYFKFTEICVFMNKHDLFEQIIKEKDPSSVFPEYTGGCDTTLRSSTSKKLSKECACRSTIS